MTTLIYLGIANGMISLCISKSKFFGPFREYLLMRSNKSFFNFIWELVSCPYCLSHWVAIIMTIIWKVRVTSSFAIADFFVTMFVNVAIATLMWAITFGLMNWAEGE